MLKAALSVAVSGVAAEKRKKEREAHPKAKTKAKAKAKRRARPVEDLDEAEDLVETPPPEEDDDDELLDPEDLNGSEWNPSEDEHGMSE